MPSQTNPLKAEYFLPSVVTELLEEGKARVKVLRSADKWYGVTYKEDKPVRASPPSRKRPPAGCIPTSCGRTDRACRRLKICLTRPWPPLTSAASWSARVRYGSGHINDTFVRAHPAGRGPLPPLHPPEDKLRRLQTPGGGHGQHRRRHLLPRPHDAARRAATRSARP